MTDLAPDPTILDEPCPADGPAVPQRRPGKPRGYPKPEGSGRKKGTPNRTTAEIRSAAQKHGAKAIRALIKLAFTSESEQVRLKALQEVLDRGYGRPVTPTELSGPEGAPIQTEELSTFDAARRVAFLLAQADAELRAKVADAAAPAPAAARGARDGAGGEGNAPEPVSRATEPRSGSAGHAEIVATVPEQRGLPSGYTIAGVVGGGRFAVLRNGVCFTHASSEADAMALADADWRARVGVAAAPSGPPVIEGEAELPPGIEKRGRLFVVRFAGQVVAECLTRSEAEQALSDRKLANFGSHAPAEEQGRAPIRPERISHNRSRP